MQDTLSTLFKLYIRDLGPGVEYGDTNWLGRQGIALALHSVADVLGSKDLPIIMTLFISRALEVVTSDESNEQDRPTSVSFRITLPDGAIKEAKKWISTPMDIWASRMSYSVGYLELLHLSCGMTKTSIGPEDRT